MTVDSIRYNVFIKVCGLKSSLGSVGSFWFFLKVKRLLNITHINQLLLLLFMKVEILVDTINVFVRFYTCKTDLF